MHLDYTICASSKVRDFPINIEAMCSVIAGHGILSPSRLSSLRTELVQFLLEKSDVQDLQLATSLAIRGPYLNLYYLLELDTEATLDVMRSAFIEDASTPESHLSLHESADANMELEKENDQKAGSDNLLIQDTINSLVNVLGKDILQTGERTSDDGSISVEAWPSRKDIAQLFEFIAYYVASGRATVSKDVLGQIIEYVTSEKNDSQCIPADGNANSKRREKQLLAVLEAVPEKTWNTSDVLHLCESANFYQVPLPCACPPICSCGGFGPLGLLSILFWLIYLHKTNIKTIVKPSLVSLSFYLDWVLTCILAMRA